jgi:hypothetical protein
MTCATLAVAALLAARGHIPFEAEIDAALAETAAIYPSRGPRGRGDTARRRTYVWRVLVRAREVSMRPALGQSLRTGQRRVTPATCPGAPERHYLLRRFPSPRRACALSPFHQSLSTVRLDPTLDGCGHGSTRIDPGSEDILETNGGTAVTASLHRARRFLGLP